MGLEMMMEAQKIWKKIKMVGTVENMQLEIDLQRKLLNFFHVGEFYYYIFDIKNCCFTYISPQIQNVLGYSPEEMTLEFFFSKIHPEDQPSMLNYEKEVVSFFAKLPAEKIGKYKFSYDYRVMNSLGEYVRILQQVMTIQFDDHKDVLLTMGVHTNISHIKKDNSSSLSFIGMDGEPSYIDVQFDKVYKPRKSLLTRREKQIVTLLMAGEQTTSIAEKLFISAHTVKTHRKNILVKTNSKSSAELTSKVIREGLI